MRTFHQSPTINAAATGTGRPAWAADATRPDRWGVILAGGEGTRLRSLTRRITGDERPKQFCPILGPQTLLDQTRRRTALAVSPDRTLFVVTRTHEPFYASVLGGQMSDRLVVQPENRGTAPAILYALLRVAGMAPAGSVAIFPSDHYVSDDAAFMAHVESAFGAIHERPGLVIVLGITPDRPEVEYGWIEPAEPILGQGPGALCGVRDFWEKPSALLARTLLAGGCLWNSFVIVARVPSLLAMIRSAAPDLYDAFVPVRSALHTIEEDVATRELYSRLPSADFSARVLVRSPARLAVLPVRDVRWNDLGDPGRVLATQRHSGWLADIGLRRQVPAGAATW